MWALRRASANCSRGQGLRLGATASCGSLESSASCPSQIRPYHALVQPCQNAKFPTYGITGRLKADNLSPYQYMATQSAQVDVFMKTSLPGNRLMMSTYMDRLYPRSNSSFDLCSGNALQSEVVRLSEDKFLVNAGPGTPRICLQDELTGVPTNQGVRFENKVGYQGLVAGESLIKKQILESIFINIVAGDSLAKEQAASRFDNLVGSTDLAAGEPLLILPRRFRQKRVWMELNKRFRTNAKVKGFIVRKVRGGCLVAVAGYIAFLPFSRIGRQRRIPKTQFNIGNMNPKSSKIVVF